MGGACTEQLACTRHWYRWDQLVNYVRLGVHTLLTRYAPVIAAAMLKRQQAQALVEARQTIVMGASTPASFCDPTLPRR